MVGRLDEIKVVIIMPTSFKVFGVFALRPVLALGFEKALPPSIACVYTSHHVTPQGFYLLITTGRRLVALRLRNFVARL
jgi:hypothetical protein